MNYMTVLQIEDSNIPGHGGDTAILRAMKKIVQSSGSVIITPTKCLETDKRQKKIGM